MFDNPGEEEFYHSISGWSNYWDEKIENIYNYRNKYGWFKNIHFGTNSTESVFLGSHNVSQTLRVMAALDSLIASGVAIPWNKTGVYEGHWVSLSRAMRNSFALDFGGTFWNVETGMWNICAELNITQFGLVQYCGSTVALDVPNPCRAPVEGKDYHANGYSGPSQSYSAAPTTAGNIGSWSCNVV